MLRRDRLPDPPRPRAPGRGLHDGHPLALSLRAGAAVLAAALTFASPAGALVGGGVDAAVQGLQSSPVYVDPAARKVLSAAEAQRVANEIEKHNAGPMYVVVMPASAADAAGGDPVGVLREVQKRLGRPGTYAGIIGTHFRAGATQGLLPVGEAGKLATESLNTHHSEGAAAVLTDFADRVGAARSGGGSSDHTGGPKGWLLLGLAGAGLGGYALVRRRRRLRELEQVKGIARNDLIALGDEIRELDVDVSMPDANGDGKTHYNEAVEIYQSADQALSRARSPQDLEPVSSELERGRYEMEAAKALLAGKEAPQRLAPCFFDPRHGPSVRMVDWAPPGGTPRPVPACAADAENVEQGLDPNVREIDYGGRRIPYWAAPAPYTPFFGGFYGGYGSGFLPGLLVGEMLGGWGDPYWGGGDSGDGDFGNGGGGDFGGGGGDFGGGDFGGGDFGGGGGDFS